MAKIDFNTAWDMVIYDNGSFMSDEELEAFIKAVEDLSDRDGGNGGTAGACMCMA